jgi:hypothetical protein
MLGENLCLLSEAAAKIPTRPNVSTVWRWHNKGIKGIRLETIRIGGTIYTSDEAIARFLEAINEPAAPAPRPRTRRETAAAVARAERILKRAGV